MKRRARARGWAIGGSSEFHPSPRAQAQRGYGAADAFWCRLRVWLGLAQGARGCQAGVGSGGCDFDIAANLSAVGLQLASLPSVSIIGGRSRAAWGAAT